MQTGVAPGRHDAVSIAVPIDVEVGDLRSITAAVAGGPHSELAARVAAGLGTAWDMPASLVTVCRDEADKDEVEARVRERTDLPVAVGFGISTAEHVNAVAEFADGAVIGSALVNAIADGPAESASERAADYIRSVLPGTHRKVVAK